MIDFLIAVMLVGGSVFALIGALGLLRMPDILIRMHASTKIGTLACGLVMAGTAVAFANGDVTVRAVLIVLFLLLTAPIASHMIGRAAITRDPKLRGHIPNAAQKVTEPHITADEG